MSTIELDVQPQKSTTQANRRPEAFKKLRRDFRRNSLISNKKQEHLFRSLTPPLPDDHPELEPLFKKGNSVEAPKSILNAPGEQPFYFSSSYPEFTNSVSGSFDSDVTSPTLGYPFTDWP